MAGVRASFDGPASYRKHGSTGYLVGDGDTQAMAEYMLQLLRDDKKRDAMGKQGRKLACNLFSSPAIAEQYLHSVYAPLVASRHYREDVFPAGEPANFSSQTRLCPIE